MYVQQESRGKAIVAEQGGEVTDNNAGQVAWRIARSQNVLDRSCAARRVLAAFRGLAWKGLGVGRSLSQL